MTIREVVKLLDAEILCGEDNLDTEIHTACGSDMMSDVLAYVKDQSVLLTGLLNPQVVRTAEMMDMLCIVVRARQKAGAGRHRPRAVEGDRAALDRKAPVRRLRHPLYQRVGRLIMGECIRLEYEVDGENFASARPRQRERQAHAQTDGRLARVRPPRLHRDV